LNADEQARGGGVLTFLIRLARPFLEGVLDRRAGRMARLIVNELTDGEQVLDLGCGDLRIGTIVTQQKDVQWTGIDTVDYRDQAVTSSSDTRIHFRVYEGDVLPFSPASFDTVVLAFVLHHCTDPAAVMDEAVRVTRGRLLIFEAVPRNRLELWIGKPYDWFVNRLRSPNIAMPFTFMTHDELVAAFQSRDLHLVRAVPVRTHPLALMQQVMYVVEKQTSRD
jgi:ubiquinone/menaquinone biosynthesis C-methylase UbiE